MTDKKKFTVRIDMTVEAESCDAALAVGIGAAEHLTDTFNDDGSINPLMHVVANPAYLNEGEPE